MLTAAGKNPCRIIWIVDAYVSREQHLLEAATSGLNGLAWVVQLLAATSSGTELPGQHSQDHRDAPELLHSKSYNSLFLRT